MAKLPRIQQLYEASEQMKHLLDIRMEEESNRLDGIPGVKPRDFTFFDDVAGNAAVRKAYETMQNQYVLRASDRISWEDAVAAMQSIQLHLRDCTAWIEYQIPVKIQLAIAQREADKHNVERASPSGKNTSVPER